MTREFQEAYRKTVQNEGFLSNHKNDAGGMTWKGIARNMHPNWLGWKEIDEILSKGGTVISIKANGYIETKVQEFYFKEFWLKSRANEIIVPIVRNKYFDTSVNLGISGAIKVYQRSLLMPVDGKLTDDFIKRLNQLKA